jgi:hypothetical protein
MRPEKQKTQATADFLGVSGFSRDVVGGCCIHNTILACSGMRGAAAAAKKGVPQAPVLPNRMPVEVPGPEKAKEPQRCRRSSSHHVDAGG